MEQTLKQLMDFVEGRIDINTFKTLISEDNNFEKVLKTDPNLKPGMYLAVWADVYSYITQENWDTTYGQFNIHNEICRYLDRNKIKYFPTSRYRENFYFLLDIQPKWLDLSEDFIKHEILNKLPEAEKTVPKIKERILDLFKYTKSEPKWVKEPEWPIVNYKPLTFIGQMDVDNYFDKGAAVFVFHNRETGEIHSVVQKY